MATTKKKRTPAPKTDERAGRKPGAQRGSVRSEANREQTSEKRSKNLPTGPSKKR
jgi:hypothetical protein